MQDKEITLVVETTQGGYTNDYPFTTKVSDVINDVINHFGFPQGDNYELMLKEDNNVDLQPSRTLNSYSEIVDNVVLILTDIGVAV